MKKKNTSFFSCSSAGPKLTENDKQWKIFKEFIFEDDTLLKQKLNEIKSDTLTYMEQMVCENLVTEKRNFLKNETRLDIEMALKLIIDFTESLLEVRT